MEEEKSSWNIFIKRTCVLRNVVVTANGFRGKLSKRLDRLIEIQDLYQSVTIGLTGKKHATSLTSRRLMNTSVI